MKNKDKTMSFLLGSAIIVTLVLVPWVAKFGLLGIGVMYLASKPGKDCAGGTDYIDDETIENTYFLPDDTK